MNFWNAVVLVGHPLPLPLGGHVRNMYLVKKIARKAQRGTRAYSAIPVIFKILKFYLTFCVYHAILIIYSVPKIFLEKISDF